MGNKITQYIDNSLIKNIDHLNKITLGERFFPIKCIYCTFHKINTRLLIMPWNYNARNTVSFSVSKFFFIYLMTPVDSTNDQNTMLELFKATCTH